MAVCQCRMVKRPSTVNASCEIDRSWMGLAPSSGEVGTVSGKAPIGTGAMELGLITCRIK